MTALLLAVSLAAAAPPEPATAVAACNTFALDLYGQLAARPGNLFFSPYSIDKALAMALAGARGETAAEMAAVLHLPGDQETAHRAFGVLRDEVNRGLAGPLGLGRRGVHISQAAALWGQAGSPVQPAYQGCLKKHYGAELHLVDFRATERARGTINAWAKEQTGGHIPELFGAGTLDSQTRLALTTAIYFKGDWVSPFKKDQTRPELFFAAPNRRGEVPMMTQTATFGYAETEDVQVLALPYQGRNLAMVVFLPRAQNGLAAVERELTAGRLAEWAGRQKEQRVQVSLPRVQMRDGFDLPDVLQALGMRRAFSRHEADFSGIDGGRERLYLGAVVHKAFLDVNELGTEASAATEVAVQALAASVPTGPRIPVFRADHPFLFAIREARTGLVLFLGRCEQP